MTMLSISVYLGIRIIKIYKKHAGECQSLQSALSMDTNLSLESLVSSYMSLLRGIFLDDLKEREKMKCHFQQIITYLRKRNAYGRQISISYFIETLFRFIEGWCHLLLPKILDYCNFNI